MKKKKWNSAGRVLACVLVLALATTGLLAQSPEATARTVPENQITRDAQGIWSVTGDSLYDVFDGMGYAEATDRLWQCELFYRSATGRLAELFGPSQLETDILARTTGYSPRQLKRGFKKLNKDARKVVKGFVNGYNRRVDEVRADPNLLPFEYKALGAQMGVTVLPMKITYRDVLSWLAFLQRQFDPEAFNQGQLENAFFLQALEGMYPTEALAMFHDLRWMNDPEALTYIPPGSAVAANDPGGPDSLARLRQEAAALPDMKKAATDVGNVFQTFKDNLKKINAYVKMGSYAWVVSGSRTASGNPIIYSGPQMGFSVPSVVVEGSLHGGGLDISGMTVPGIPGIIIGRTPHHAWTMQVGHAHSLDYFIESPLTVKKWRVTTIKVAGQPDYKLKIYKSIHGPVINPMPYNPKHLDDVIVTWDYANRPFEFKALEGILELATAQSMDDFDVGIHKVAVSMHFCYADRDGNIAYWMSGFDPIRSPKADPRMPTPGDLKHEWPKPVTYKPLSTDRNNAQGYYCGWNNKTNINYDNAPQNLHYAFGPFHGAHVVNDYLSTHTNLTFEQVRDLAINIATTDSFALHRGVPWTKVGPYFLQAVQDYPNPNRLAFLGMVLQWDQHFVAGGPAQWVAGPLRSDAWVIEETWIENMIKLTFSDELGPDNVVPDGQFLNVLIHALEGQGAGVPNYYNWFQDHAGVGLPTDPEQLIVLALDMTMQELGSPPYNEPRGEITYVHDMLGPIHATPYANRSTYAHCVEFGPSGPIRIESMFPLGESGTILMDSKGAPLFDPNFFSMAPVYDAFSPRPFPLFP